MARLDERMEILSPYKTPTEVGVLLPGTSEQRVRFWEVQHDKILNNPISSKDLLPRRTLCMRAFDVRGLALISHQCSRSL